MMRWAQSLFSCTGANTEQSDQGAPGSLQKLSQNTAGGTACGHFSFCRNRKEKGQHKGLNQLEHRARDDVPGS